jgi:hypothetical protein
LRQGHEKGKAAGPAIPCHVQGPVCTFEWASTLLMTLRNAHRHAAMMSGRGLFIASHLGSSGDRRTGQTAFWQCTKTIGI